MNRRNLLVGHIGKHQQGIEIGPWLHPLLPKREGFAVTTLDVFPTEELKRRARLDPNLADVSEESIETVDLVGSACDIGEIVARHNRLATFDYIVASHAFEHLPDPIRFLQGCEAVLRPGGILSMAIPDKRGCFDHFRPVSTLAEMLAAFFEQRRQPTPAQIFERWSLHGRWCPRNGNESISFSRSVPQQEIEPYDSLHQAYSEWKETLQNPAPQYRDTHCWVLTPAAFQLILLDLQTLGLTHLQCVRLVDCDSEFVVHLEKPVTPPAPLTNEERQRLRRQFLHAMVAESGYEYAEDVLGGNSFRRVRKRLSAVFRSRLKLLFTHISRRLR